MIKPVTLLFALFIAQSAFAQMDGDLDLTFNGTGFQTYQPGNSLDNGYDVEALPDGKILVGGISGTFSNFELAAIRVNPDGSYDTGFGTNGIYIHPNTAGNDFGYDLAALPDGSSLLAGGWGLGSNNVAFVVLKLDAAGKPDPNFGTNGVATVDFDAGEDYCQKIIPQPDGSIICIGTSAVPGFSLDHIALCKLTPTGSLDPSFGPNGTGKYLSPGTFSIEITDAVQTPDALFVCGHEYNSSAFSDYPVLMKFSPNGIFDTSFGNAGFLKSSTKGRIWAINFDGNALHLAGSDESSTSGTKVLILSWLPDGSANAAFGSNGKVSEALGVVDLANDLKYQPDGKIVVAGGSGTGGFAKKFMVARFDKNGQLDPTFGGGDGFMTQLLGTTSSVAYGLAFQVDGKIVAAGTGSSASNDMGIMRLENKPSAPGQLTATISAINPDCFSETGSATVFALGGTSPFVFTLNNGATNSTGFFGGLAAGVYSVVITDAVGSSLTLPFSIVQPPLLTGSYSVVNGTELLMQATGGTPPYVYLFQGFELTDPNLGAVPDGNYSIVIRDANGCLATVDVSFVETDEPTGPSFQVFPTVGSGPFTISRSGDRETMLRIFDSSGKLVASQLLARGETTAHFSMKNHEKGLFLIELDGKTARMVVR